MRIAYVTSTLNRCGPTNVLFDLACTLSKNHDVAVYTLAREPENTRIADFQAANIPVECLAASRIQSMVRGKAALERALNRFSADVVHVHGFRATLLARHFALPKIVTVHNCLIRDYRHTYGRSQALFMARTESAAQRDYDCIAACSQSNAGFLREAYHLPAIAIRNGVDQTVYHAVPAEERLAMRRSLGLVEDSRVFITTGGCSTLKGTQGLIDSFNAFSSSASGDKSELHVFGGGALLEECRERAGSCVHVHGFSDDIVPWLQASDVYVSNSSTEGMPLAVLEALSCGCTALLSDIPAHREIAQVAGGSSVAICPADALDYGWTAMLHPLSFSQAEPLGAQAMAQAYLEWYSMLLKYGRDAKRGGV